MRLTDEDLLGALARLSTNRDFVLVMENLFQKEYDNAIEACIREEKPGRYQGKAEFLKDFITTVNGARDAHRSRTAHVDNMGGSL
jgi:hypothetical protein